MHDWISFSLTYLKKGCAQKGFFKWYFTISPSNPLQDCMFWEYFIPRIILKIQKMYFFLHLSMHEIQISDWLDWSNFTEQFWELCWSVEGREMILHFLLFWILAQIQEANCCKLEFTRKERARREVRGGVKIGNASRKH